MPGTRTSLAVWLAVVFWTVPAVATDAAGVSGDRPDIVLIMIDTLRADHVGCYGYPHRTTPVIDEIAAESLVFTDAVAAAPWTSPSVASVFTSLYPGAHRVLDHLDKFERPGDRTITDVLAEPITTLAEGLRDAGYETVGFVANAWVNAEFGFGQGFEYYDDVKGKGRRSGDEINQAAVQWLRRRDDHRPLFLYMHYMDVHGPYNAPTEYREPFVEPLREEAQRGELTPMPRRVTGFSVRLLKDPDQKLARYLDYWLARYDAGILQCDTYIGNLRRSLEALDLWDGSFVVITSDHGEEFAEHGGADHGRNLHFHQLQVPLVIRTPWNIEPARIGATVSLVDVAPTLWEVAGAEVPPAAQGKSLLPMIWSVEQRKASYAFAEGVKRAPERVSVQYEGRKLMEDRRLNRVQYYDLRTDPTEQRPSTIPLDETSTLLEPALSDWLRRTRSPEPAEAPKTTIDPQTEDLLRSLGYLSEDD